MELNVKTGPRIVGVDQPGNELEGSPPASVVLHAELDVLSPLSPLASRQGLWMTAATADREDSVERVERLDEGAGSGIDVGRHRPRLAPVSVHMRAFLLVLG